MNHKQIANVRTQLATLDMDISQLQTDIEALRIKRMQVQEGRSVKGLESHKEDEPKKMTSTLQDTSQRLSLCPPDKQEALSLPPPPSLLQTPVDVNGCGENQRYTLHESISSGSRNSNDTSKRNQFNGPRLDYGHSSGTSNLWEVQQEYGDNVKKCNAANRQEVCQNMEEISIHRTFPKDCIKTTRQEIRKFSEHLVMMVLTTARTNWTNLQTPPFDGNHPNMAKSYVEAMTKICRIFRCNDLEFKMAFLGHFKQDPLNPALMWKKDIETMLDDISVEKMLDRFLRRHDTLFGSPDLLEDVTSAYAENGTRRHDLPYLAMPIPTVDKKDTEDAHEDWCEQTLHDRGSVQT